MLVNLQKLRDRLVQEPISSTAAAVNKWSIPSALELPNGFVIPEVPGLKILTPEEQFNALVDIRTGRDLDFETDADHLCDICFSVIYGDEPCETDHEESIPSGPLLDWIPIYEGLHEEEPARIFVCANPASSKWGSIGLDNFDSHGRRGFDAVSETLEEILLQYKVLYDVFMSQEELRSQLKHHPYSEHVRIFKEFGVIDVTYSPLTTLRDEKGFLTYFG